MEVDLQLKKQKRKTHKWGLMIWTFPRNPLMWGRATHSNMNGWGGVLLLTVTGWSTSCWCPVVFFVHRKLVFQWWSWTPRTSAPSGPWRRTWQRPSATRRLLTTWVSRTWSPFLLHWLSVWRLVYGAWKTSTQNNACYQHQVYTDCQGTLLHSHLSWLSHCGLILA